MTKAELDALRQTNIEIANRIYDYEIEIYRGVS